MTLASPPIPNVLARRRMKNGAISGPAAVGARAPTGTRIVQNVAPKATNPPPSTSVAATIRARSWLPPNLQNLTQK
eukprot:4219263-Pleurochrysis_carterae.AAC.1